MARCDEGYLCEVCGEDVGNISDSDLYLRFVIGELDPERLHTTPERHIRCNPAVGQFIVHPDFEPLVCEGAFNKQELDPEYVQQRETLVSRGFERLREIEAQGPEGDITSYPLPEAIAKYRR
ncbi:hypothetical protein Poly24_06820 [Rosistilla carotiformis]|uniref:Uncharacterized protein n=1 Tax=Rosistilla carotiformis TaxID=2528017 RepID=A0A518JNA1_9BACT|nr:hypothetical protein [Rosistilla carotiformis]QDV66991.1 hypothetical protein Poly24_06820 [Rosistilla carotiformis]